MTGLPVLLALVVAQAPPVFPTRVEQVYVDVLVTKGDAPVYGLEAANARRPCASSHRWVCRPGK